MNLGHPLKKKGWPLSDYLIISELQITLLSAHMLCPIPCLMTEAPLLIGLPHKAEDKVKMLQVGLR